MQVYEKVGRRYRLLGNEFLGFPAEGLWWYTRTNGGSSETWLASKDQIPALDLAALHIEKREIIKEIYKKYNKNEPYSINDIVEFVLEP